MAVCGPRDREWLSVTAFTLIESSRPAQIKAFTMAQLRAGSMRARKYWEHYRTLSRQQRRTNKSDVRKDRSQPLSNVRTERKAQLFAEALRRFEIRATQIQTRDQPQQGARAKARVMHDNERKGGDKGLPFARRGMPPSSRPGLSAEEYLPGGGSR